MSTQKPNNNFVDIDLDIKYTNKEHLTISEVIRSLENAEKLILRTKPFIEKASDGYVIDNIEVFIEEAQSGSFWSKLKTRVYYGSEENKEVAENAALDYLENTNMKYLLPMLVGGVIGAGIYGAVTSLSAPSTSIEAYNSTIFNFGDNATITTEEAQSILDSIRDKATLAKEATAFVSPAKKDPDASILIGSLDNANENNVVKIPPKVIAQSPESYEPPKPTTKEEHFNKIYVNVIRLETISNNNWTGTIDGIATSPVKIIFADDIDATKIFQKKIYCNVEVTSKFVKSKKAYKATEIFISKVLPNPK